MAPVAMLLLDHNLPHQLRDLLTTFGLESETASSRGWERLRNGELVTAAHAAGFDTIFIRDLKFAESASNSLLANRKVTSSVMTKMNPAGTGLEKCSAARSEYPASWSR
jgi:hypothetical protein